MSELAYRMMLAAKKSAAAAMPKLGDFVSFAHPVFGTPSGYIIMRMSEAGQPARCEVIVRHGNTGWATYHWRRADELTVLANANPENHRYLRYSVRHQEEQAGETS